MGKSNPPAQACRSPATACGAGSFCPVPIRFLRARLQWMRRRQTTSKQSKHMASEHNHQSRTLCFARYTWRVGLRLSISLMHLQYGVAIYRGKSSRIHHQSQTDKRRRNTGHWVAIARTDPAAMISQTSSSIRPQLPRPESQCLRFVESEPPLLLLRGSASCDISIGGFSSCSCASYHHHSECR